MQQLLNGLISVEVTTSLQSATETFVSVAELVNAAELDLGEFQDSYIELAQKVETAIANEEEVEFTDDEVNLTYGLALLMDIQF